MNKKISIKDLLILVLVVSLVVLSVRSYQIGKRSVQNTIAINRIASTPTVNAELRMPQQQVPINTVPKEDK